MNKKIILLAVLALLSAGAFYGLSEYNRTRKDSKAIPAKFTVSASELLNEFLTDEETARKKYAGNELIISVYGNIKKLQQDTPGAYAVILGDSSANSSVICLMDSVYEEEIRILKPNEPVQLKGRFSGFKADELGIGADIELNFCVVDKKSK